MDSDLKDDLSVGVAEYLKEWGLSDETITNFENNHITLKLLDDIQETELKELIPSLKDRILFMRGLKKLRNIIQATESDDTLSIDSDFSALSPTYSTSSDELPAILNANAECWHRGAWYGLSASWPKPSSLVSFKIRKVLNPICTDIISR